MSTDIKKELAKLEYDESEMERRQKVVLADLNRYIRRKYPELLDAEVMQKSTKSCSVLDICGIRLKPLNNQKLVFLCLMGKGFAKCERIKITFQLTSNIVAIVDFYWYNCKYPVSNTYGTRNGQEGT